MQRFRNILIVPITQGVEPPPLAASSMPVIVRSEGGARMGPKRSSRTRIDDRLCAGGFALLDAGGESADLVLVRMSSCHGRPDRGVMSGVDLDQM